MSVISPPETLFEAQLAWAESYARRFVLRRRIPLHLHEELANEARVALWHHCPRWDGSGSFRAWAGTRLQSALVNYLRALYGRRVERGRVSLEGVRGLAAPANGLEHVDAADACAALWARLTPRERRLAAALGRGENGEEIGAREHLSRARVGQLLADLRRKVAQRAGSAERWPK